VQTPAELGDGEGKRPTADVHLAGVDRPVSRVITTNGYATVARKRSSAQAAQVGSDAGVQEYKIPPGTTIGPVQVSGTLRYNPGSREFEAELDGSLDFPDVAASIHMILGDGRLKLLEGEVDARVMLFADVFLDSIHFKVVTNPLVLNGGVHLSTEPKLLTATAALTIQPDPIDVLVEGRVKLADKFELGSAFVRYRDNPSKITFGGHIGTKIGPAELSLDVRGGLALPDFFVEGAGRGCFAVCLDVKALVSNVALAACGSVNLALVKFSGGAAWVFPKTIDVFTGCDLSPYVPASLRDNVIRAVGGAKAFDVPAGLDTVSIKVTGDPAAVDAPRVVISAPAGDDRVIETPVEPGDYGFGGPRALQLGGGTGAGQTLMGTAIVDQDPIRKVTTVVVGKPKGGAWTIAPAPGAPGFTRVEIARGERPLARADFGAESVKKAAVSGGKISLAGRTFAIAARTRDAAVVPQNVPDVELPRLRSIVLHPPRALAGKVTLVDRSPEATNVIGSFDPKNASSKGVPVVFDPSTDVTGTHELVAFVTYDNGLPRAAVTLDTFAAPPVPTPPKPTLDVSRTAVGYNVVIDPRGVPLGSRMAAPLDLVATDGRGTRIERRVTRRDLKAIGDGRYLLKLKGLDHQTRVRVFLNTIYARHRSAQASDEVRARHR